MSRSRSIVRWVILLLLLLGGSVWYLSPRDDHQVSIVPMDSPVNSAPSSAIVTTPTGLPSPSPAPDTGQPVFQPFRDAVEIAVDRQVSASGTLSQKRLLRTSFKHPLIVEKTVAHAPSEYYLADRVLLGAKTGTSENDLQGLVKRYGGTLRNEGGFYVVTFPEADLGTVPEAIARFQHETDLVAYAEVDSLQFSHDLPNDPELPKQEYLTEIDAFGAWLIPADTSSVTVAVVDSGIRISHEDLCDNLWVNSGEIPANGRDDDANGWIDDFHGYDFYSNHPTLSDSDGHGTSMAGIIAARSDNGLGIAGIAGKARLMGIRFMDREGYGTTSDAIKSIEYAIRNRSSIINASWGNDTYQQSLYDAVKKARDFGILFIASAGNDGRNVDQVPSYPACFNLDNIISVGACMSNDTRWPNSNYGVLNVDLCASFEAWTTTTYGDSTYSYSRGTSTAAAVVSGCVAYLHAVEPKLPASDLRRRILQHVRQTSALTNICSAGGVVQLNQTVRQKAVEQIQILNYPINQNLVARSPLLMQVEAISALPLSYTWYKDGQLLPGEVSSLFYVPLSTVADAGEYTVVISNADTRRYYRVLVRINVMEPYCMHDLQDQTLELGSKVILEAQFGGSYELFYFWYRYGELVAETSLPRLEFDIADSASAGVYWVIASTSPILAEAQYQVHSSHVSVRIADPSLNDLRLLPQNLDASYYYYYFKGRYYTIRYGQVYTSLDAFNFNPIYGVTSPMNLTAQSADVLVFFSKHNLFATREGRSFTAIDYTDLPIPMQQRDSICGMEIENVRFEGEYFWVAAKILYCKESGNPNDYLYYQSKDGLVWDLQTNVHPSSVAYGHAGYLSVNGLNIYLSEDTREWQQSSSLPLWGNPTCYYYLGQYFIYNGYQYIDANKQYCNQFFVSRNGSDWEERLTKGPVGWLHHVSQINGKLFFLSNWLNYVSDDGCNFRPVSNAMKFLSIVYTPQGWLGGTYSGLYTWSSQLDFTTTPQPPEFGEPIPDRVPLYSTIFMSGVPRNIAATRSVSLMVNDKVVEIDHTSPYTFSYTIEHPRDCYFSLLVEEMDGKWYESATSQVKTTTGSLRNIGNSPGGTGPNLVGPIFCANNSFYFTTDRWSNPDLFITSDGLNYRQGRVYDPLYPEEQWRKPVWFNGYFFSSSRTGRIAVSQDGEHWISTTWEKGFYFTFQVVGESVRAMHFGDGSCYRWEMENSWTYLGVANLIHLEFANTTPAKIYARKCALNSSPIPTILDGFYFLNTDLYWKIEEGFPFNKYNIKEISSNGKWYCDYAGKLIREDGRIFEVKNRHGLIYSEDDVLANERGSNLVFTVDGSNWIELTFSLGLSSFYDYSFYQQGRRLYCYLAQSSTVGSIYEVLLSDLRLVSLTGSISNEKGEPILNATLIMRNASILSLGGSSHPIQLEAELIGDANSTIHTWLAIPYEEILARGEHRSLNLQLDLPARLPLGNYRLRVRVQTPEDQEDFTPEDNTLISDVLYYDPYVDCHIEVAGKGTVERSAAAPYWPDTELGLWARPAAGHQFTGWRTWPGEEIRWLNPLPLKLTRNFVVEAGFAPDGAVGAFADLQYDGQGWHGQPALGKFFPDYFPWIVHQEHGWWYVAPIGPHAWFFYDPVLQWLWTDSQTYPFLFAYGQQEWLYYWPGSSHPRFFYQTYSLQWQLIE